jgi:hypothetical protein
MHLDISKRKLRITRGDDIALVVPKNITFRSFRKGTISMCYIVSRKIFSHFFLSTFLIYSRATSIYIKLLQNSVTVHVNRT